MLAAFRNYATINLKLQQFTLVPGNDPVSAIANSETVAFDKVISYSFAGRYLTFYIRNSRVDPVFFRDLPCYTFIRKLHQFTVIFTDYSQPSSNFLIICVMTAKHELLIRAWPSSFIHQCTGRLHTESCHLNFCNLRQIAFVNSLAYGPLICRDSCCYPIVTCCNLLFEAVVSVSFAFQINRIEEWFFF
jgi:hypothetical protein